MRSSALARGIAALTVGAATAAVLTAGGSAATATTTSRPAWEPDPNAIGTITFYDHTGNVVTSGSTNVPFAGYAVGSAASGSSDTQAGLGYANPEPGKSTYSWYVHLAGAFTSYPVTGTAPSSITSQTSPVYTVGDDDQTIDDFESGAKISTQSGYTDMVQVRLYTTDSSGRVDRNSYDDADLLINPSLHTWTEVYPSGSAVTPDRTSLSISAPSAVKYDATAKITGALKDTTKGTGLSGQTVGLYEGSKKVASAKSGPGGSLSASVKLTGKAALHWVYAGTASYTKSTSATKTVSVTTAVSIAVDHSSIKHGATATFYGSTTPATSGIRVELQQLVGRTWKNVASGVQKRQTLPNKKTAVAFRISHKFAKKGTYTFRVSKAATSSLSGSVSRTITEHVK